MSTIFYEYGTLMALTLKAGGVEKIASQLGIKASELRSILDNKKEMPLSLVNKLKKLLNISDKDVQKIFFTFKEKKSRRCKVILFER